MQIEQKQYDVGVIVGRFQVPELHVGHMDLIDTVMKQHEKVVVFLGVSPLWATLSNPLDFEARKQMLLAQFPNLIVLYIKDQPSDRLWSVTLDGMISDVVAPSQSVVLYGSRDSFLPHYTGSFKTRALETTSVLSGTAARKLILRSSTRDSADFRAGVAWAAGSRFPTAFTTVDVAIMDGDYISKAPKREARVLLGRKPGSLLWQFIGGFSDPRSESFEADAIREVTEEAAVEIGDLRYVGSRVQDDWRYRNEQDCIKTMLFVADYVFGRPTPGDDIEEVRWFPLGFRNLNHSLDIEVIDAHKPLLQMLRAWLIQNGEE